MRPIRIITTRSVLICTTKEAARQIATEKASDRG